jgi:exonuclease VII large subunit
MSELIDINREILLKGLFSLKFSEVDEQVTSEIDELETKKKEIQNRLAGMSDEYKQKITEYKERLIETENKYKLNLERNPTQSITEKIEDYKIYKGIYDEHYDYIVSTKELSILENHYDTVDYYYLITKI